VRYISADNRILEMLDRIKASLFKSGKTAEEELARIYNDKEQQPITYNHYYSNNVQNSRHDTTRTLIKKAIGEASIEKYNRKLYISNTTLDAKRFLNAL
jgi:hypothetical protein